MPRPAALPLAAALALLAASPLSLAADQARASWIGLGIGQPNYDEDCKELTGTGFTGSCDDNETTWKIFAGHDFHRYWGAEIAYVDLGKLQANGTLAGFPVSASAKIKAINFSAMGHYNPMPQLRLFGKLGVARWDVDAEAYTTGGSYRASEDGIDPSFGVGAQWDFTPNLGLRGEWQRFLDVGETSTTGQSDIDLLSLSLVLSF